jgi:hypothetical protein
MENVAAAPAACTVHTVQIKIVNKIIGIVGFFIIVIFFVPL